jgi:F-type H+-transporting ATPase subunit delta
VKAREATARRYAKALFALAQESGAVESIGTELDGFLALFAEHAEARDVLLRPWIKPGDREAVAREMARRSGFSTVVQNFVGLVAGRGRADHFQEMVEAYRALVDQAAGRVRAEVRTAVPLTTEEKRRLEARLGQSLGKQIVLEETLDRSLLGGFVAQVGGLVLDGSLDGQLRMLRERLARG